MQLAKTMIKAAFKAIAATERGEGGGLGVSIPNR